MLLILFSIVLVFFGALLQYRFTNLKTWQETKNKQPQQAKIN